MTFLGEWLKEIIVIVLIAVFIDLLLPNRAMERYVKFVVSLLILLTLISPVMRLFSSDAKREIETAFANSWNQVDEGDRGASTEVILRQGELLRRQQEAEALQWAGDEAAKQMKLQIERETGQPVERVTVKLTAEPSPEQENSEAGQAYVKPSIKSVEVVMGLAGQIPAQEPANKRAIDIQPVAKVEVKITETLAEGEDSRSANGNYGDSASQQQKAIRLETITSIEELLSREWGISKEAVTVVEADEEQR